MTLEDHNDYFLSEFAVAAQVTLADATSYQTRGIFDQASAEEGGVETVVPTLLVASEDNADLAEGDTINLPARNPAGALTGEQQAYTVRDLQPDGTGHLLIVLRETPAS